MAGKAKKRGFGFLLLIILIIIGIGVFFFASGDMGTVTYVNDGAVEDQNKEELSLIHI